MKRIMRTGMAVALLAGPTVGGIDKAAAEQNAYRLGEIVVTGETESVVETSGTTYRVTAEQIKDQNAHTLDEALQLVPGVTIREGAEGTPRIDVRGFRTRHVQLFMNGVPVRTSNDGQFDPTMIPANIISEIKVTSGGGSVLYGAGGNGAVIDIITKSGQEGVHGSVSGEIGEGGSYEAKANVAASGEKLDVFASVVTQNRDEFILSDDFEATKAEDGDERLNSDRERSSVFTNLSYRATDATTLGLTVNHTEGENGKPPVTNYDKTDKFTKSPKYERTENLKNSLVQAAVNHETGNGLDLRGWAYYSTTEMDENVYTDKTYSTLDSKKSESTETDIAGASLQGIYHISKGSKATLGLTAENETWDSDQASKGDIDEMQTYSMMFEYEVKPTDELGLVAGFGEHFNQQDGGDDQNDFSYLLGATYDLSDITRLRANHARKVRFASLKQLNDSKDGTADGLPDLDTEVTYHYELGVDQKLGEISSLSVTGFYIDANDFIEKDDDGITRNYQDITFKGIETDFEINPVDELKLRLAVTWMDTEDNSSDSDRDELQYRPEWTINAEAKYHFAFGLTAYASCQYIDKQYFYNSDGSKKKELNDITVVNLKLTQSVADTGVEVYAGVTNLFDKDYEESYGLPQPGRMLYAGLAYSF